jgi:DeoR/GlpR family transcriptional regulator of sugar metabolism
MAGKLSTNTQILVGAQVVNQLDELEPDICFLGTNGVSLKNGITDSDWFVVQVKKAMIKAADQLVVLSIFDKLDTSKKMKVCPLDSVSCLITDLDPKNAILNKYATKVKLL